MQVANASVRFVAYVITAGGTIVIRFFHREIIVNAPS